MKLTKFKEKDRCPKCESDDLRKKFYGKSEVYAEEHLAVYCIECNYHWDEEPADKETKNEETKTPL